MVREGGEREGRGRGEGGEREGRGRGEGGEREGRGRGEDMGWGGRREEKRREYQFYQIKIEERRSYDVVLGKFD